MTTTGKHDADRPGVTDNSQKKDTQVTGRAEDADEAKRKENGQKMSAPGEMQENRVGESTETSNNNNNKNTTSNGRQPSPLQQALRIQRAREKGDLHQKQLQPKKNETSAEESDATAHADNTVMAEMENSLQEERPDQKSQGASEQGTPFNLDKNNTCIGQASDVCAAGDLCKARRSILTDKKRCMGCGWCVHLTCCVELKQTKTVANKTQLLPLHIRDICLQCVTNKEWQGKIMTVAGTRPYITLSKTVMTIMRRWRNVVLCDWEDGTYKFRKEENLTFKTSKNATEGLTKLPSKKVIKAGKSVAAAKQKIPQAETQQQQKGAAQPKPSTIQEYVEEQQQDQEMTMAIVNPYATKNVQQDSQSNDQDATMAIEQEEGAMEEEGKDDASVATVGAVNVAEEPSTQAQPDPMSTTEGQASQTQALATTPITTVVTDKIYLDIQLVIPAPKTKPDPDVALATPAKKLKDWFGMIHQFCPSFALNTIDPDSETITVLRDIKKFPTTYMDIKSFFKQAATKPKGGRLFMKVLATFNDTPEKLINAVDWYHKAERERISISPIQAYSTALVGCLLYSLRSMDAEALKYEISRTLHKTINIRWMKMADGEAWVEGRDARNDPQAMHVECSEEDREVVEDWFKTTYSSTATRFPLHIRMRFVPQFSKLMSFESSLKHTQMRNRQHGWCMQSGAISTSNIILIDSTIPGHGATTIRDAIMKIKSSDTSLGDVPLISSIDKMWRGRGFNYSYHPKRAVEASMVIKGLFPRLAYEFGEENITAYFSPLAVKEGRTLQYDPKTHQVTSEADIALATLADADKDMDLSEYTKAAEDVKKGANFGERAEEFVGERIPGSSDSMSTFNKNGAKSDKPVPVVDLEEGQKQSAQGEERSSYERNTGGNDDSTTSTLSKDTKQSINSRISGIETNVSKQFSDFKSQMDEMMTAILSIKQSTSNLTPVRNSNPQGMLISPAASQGTQQSKKTTTEISQGLESNIGTQPEPGTPSAGDPGKS